MAQGGGGGGEGVRALQNEGTQSNARYILAKTIMLLPIVIVALVMYWYIEKIAVFPLFKILINLFRLFTFYSSQSMKIVIIQRCDLQLILLLVF